MTSRVRVNGLEVAYTSIGRGSSLVLLHGGMDDLRSWRRQLDGLSDEFSVVAWDAPGCGESSEPPITWRIHDFADCLAGWLAAIGIDRPHVLGLSWGSTVALELVHRHPDVPASLILVSPYAGWAGSLPADEVADRLDRVLAAADLSADAIIREGLPGLLSESTPAEVVAEVSMISAANNGRAHPAGYRAIAHSMAEADLRESLPAITTPTLVIHGELDQRAPYAVAARLHERIPSSELAVIPNAGHLCNVEMPAEFNRLVREFIHSLDESDRIPLDEI